MLVIDIAAVLVVIGLGVIATAITSHWVKKKRLGDPRYHAKQRQLLGERNTLVVELRAQEVCAACRGTTTARDVFADGEWFHQDCYRNHCLKEN